MENSKEKNFVSAVIYIHNDGYRIKGILKNLYELFDKNFLKFEIICVNDNSTDDSVMQIKEFSSQVSNATISIVNMSLYQGIELAMGAGVDLSIGDFVFEFDSVNFDYDLALILDVYFHSLKGFDVVSASPKKIRKLSSKLFYTIFNSNSQSPYKLRSEAFRIISRRGINRVHSISKTIPYRKALYANSGLKIDTIFYQSTHATIKSDLQTQETRSDLAIDSLILFTNIAYKISYLLSGTLLIITLLAGIYACVIFFGKHRPIEGWTTTMLLLTSGFFGIFLLLAIIIKYLSVLVDLVFKRQKYLIESIEKVKN